MTAFLLALVLAAFTGWIIKAVADGAIDRAVSAFRELIGGWRPDPWPRGVQEEDRDRPWGSPTPTTPATPSTPIVATAHVKAHIRAR